jgi:hypothetical protein
VRADGGGMEEVVFVCGKFVAGSCDPNANKFRSKSKLCTDRPGGRSG